MREEAEEEEEGGSSSVSSISILLLLSEPFNPVLLGLIWRLEERATVYRCTTQQR